MSLWTRMYCDNCQFVLMHCQCEKEEQVKLSDRFNSYSIGNYNLGLQLALRNLFEKKDFTIRYIQLIFKLLGTQFIFEFKFANSI